MYRVIKFFETKNGKIRCVVVRKYSSYDMAEFAATCIANFNLSDENVVVGFQRC